jgi:hypothetical protein
MAVLRNVPKTFSFEEQRLEINAIAQDLYDLNAATTASGPTTTVVINPTPWQSGLLEYDSETAEFTFTPPDLSGIPSSTKVAEWDEAHGWGDHSTEGYLTSLPSHTHDLQTLGDVSLSGGDAPSDGEALVWNQTAGKWKAGTVSSGWQGNVQNSTTPNGPGRISFDANTNTLVFQPTNIDLILADLNNFNNVTLTSVQNNDILVWNSAQYDFINQPATLDLNSDVDTTGVAQGKTLRYNGTKWVVSQDVSYSQTILGGNTNSETSVQWDLTPTIDGGVGIADSITITGGNDITFSNVSTSGFTIDYAGGGGTPAATTLTSLSDTSIPGTITLGHVLKWDGTAWGPAPDNTSSGGSGIALTDISVVKPNPVAQGSGDLTYNSTSGAFTYTPPALNFLTAETDTLDSVTSRSSGNTTTNSITVGGNGSSGGITLADGNLALRTGTGNVASIDLYCEVNNAHKVSIKAPLHANYSGNVNFVLPPDEGTDGYVLSTNGSGTTSWVQQSSGGDTYSLHSLLSTGIELQVNGQGVPANRIFFDAGTGITITRTNTNPHTIEFEASLGLNDLSDTTIPGNITQGHVLKWDGTAWGPAPDNTSSGGSGISLTDISVAKPNPSPQGNGDVTYNSTSGVFTYTPPALPTVPTNLGDLSNVSSGGPSDGDFLKWVQNNNRWEPVTQTVGSGTVTSVVAGTGLQGGTITTSGTIDLNATLNDLTDVNLGTVAEGKILKYTSGSWSAEDESAGGGGTTYNVVSTTENGLAPQLPSSHGGKYLRADGTWEVPPDTNPSATLMSDWNTAYGWGNHANAGYLTSAPGEANVQSDWTQTNTTSDDYIKNKPGAFGGTASGLVPSSTSGETGKFLRSDGTWQDVSSGGASTLNELSDVDTSGASNGKVLKHNGTSWIVASDNDTTSFAMGSISDVDYGGGSASSGKILKHNGSNWALAEESGVPSGTIVMYNSTSAPSGWAICNGSSGTPDLRDRFVIGAGSSYSGGSTGGYTDSIVVSHNHGTNTMSTHNGHTHGDGNLSTSNTGDHYHAVNSLSFNGDTGNQSANHHHTLSMNLTVGGGSHGHNIRTNSWDNGGNYSGPQNAWSGDSQYNYNDVVTGGAHNHTASIVHDTLGVSVNHTHSFSGNVSGNTTNSSTGDHSHNVNGNTGGGGSHNHNISVNSEGNSGSGRNLPPYYALTFIMKL